MDVPGFQFGNTNANILQPPIDYQWALQWWFILVFIGIT
jgi:hypothetical protein